MKTLEKLAVELHQRKLANGANLFLFSRKGMPIFIRTLFFAGSRFDTIPGTSHFLEHMLVAGTEKFPTKNLIAKHLERVGGDFGAATNGNFVRFDIEIPESGDLIAGMEVLDQCLNHSLFDERTIENERGSIFSEIKSRKSNPNEVVVDLFNSLAFQGTLLEKGVRGEIEDVKSISRAVLIDHKNSFINSGHACFIAAGDISIDQLASFLSEVNLPYQKRFNVQEILPIINITTSAVKRYSDVKELHIMLGCRTSFDDYKEYCALQALNIILAVGRGSRLTTLLRYKNGLVYSVSGSIVDSGDWGSFRIKLTCDRNNWEKARKLIYDLFDDIRKGGVLESELEIVKCKISKGMIRNLQTSKSWVDNHDVEALLSPESLHTVEDYVQNINSLSVNDISFVANKYLEPKYFYTAICGDIDI